MRRLVREASADNIDNRSMGDTDGPLIAQRIYQALFERGGQFLDPEVVPFALDSAVTTMREQGLHPSRWAPYVDVGI